MALISIKGLLLSPMDIDIRNIKTTSGIKVMCRIQDEYGLDLDVPVIESNNDYYVDI